jgi:acetoin utilization deacetylase AcuC-like enzyme
VLVLYDDRMLAHKPQLHDPFLPGRLEKRVREILAGLDMKWSYPEHPGRLTVIRDLLQAEPIEGLRFADGAVATREQIGRVHTAGYLDHIFAMRGGSAWLDVDTTAVSRGSVEAAEVAAGTAVAAVEAVVSGQAENAFALIRPPGHHAEPGRARGFCLFNNIAIAAAHARAQLGCSRVMIVDWDAHHGNGTQDIFWADPDVLFFDIHRAAPYYPGSGLLEDVGAGLGEGTTVNVPMPDGAGDVAYVKAFREILVPAADWFKPDLLLVSAGIDPHRLDLALNLGYEGFAAMTGILQEVADRHCGGRLAMVLEGGYHLEALARGVHTVLKVMAGASPDEVSECGVAEAVAAAAFHRDAFTEN